MSIAISTLSFGFAVLAGAFGAVLGIGGGLLIIPALNLFLGVSLKIAIATSLVAVIATSSGAGNVYVLNHLADVRLGLVLALATAPGAVAGALLTPHVSTRLLAGIFAAILIASAYRMSRNSDASSPGKRSRAHALTHGVHRLRFQGEYRETPDGSIVRYSVENVPLGVAASILAGLMSGLLGVGGGIIQVPVMTLIMGVPIKVATTTSTYVIGITATAGAFVYYNHRPSMIDPRLVVPIAVGVVIGASAGSRLLPRLNQRILQSVFVAVLALYALQMVLRAAGVGA